MKVMCIDNKNAVTTKRAVISELVEGIEYEVAQCPFHQNSYLVKGVSIQFGGHLYSSYKKSRFIALSDHDETETEVYKNLQVQTA